MSGPTLSSKEIASLRNVSERAIQKLAVKENWPFKKIPRPGGFKKLYPLDTLPEDIQLLYNKEQMRARADAEAKAIVPAVKFFAPAVRVSEAPALLQAPIVLARCQKQQALYKYDLLRLYKERINSAPYGQKVPARDSFIKAYNSGQLFPKLFEELGPVQWKTIEGWKSDVKAARNDCFILADQRGAWKRGLTCIGHEHEKILLACLLHPNNPRIAESIRLAREIMYDRGIENGYSEATYRRWIKEWRERNDHIWTYTREGWKAWNDKCALSGERDFDLINVGDVVVADGHTLNFEIINPWTGKPKRMTLILWIDMKATFPLGWEIMPSENTQAIASSLRWAILRLGKIPKIAYVDNGKAFGAKFFNGKALDHEGFTGLFERLGMQVIHARPYRGQSKTIERFFGSLSEIERWVPTFTGTSIETKPPGMMRGEKLHRKVRAQMAGGGVTLEMAHTAVAEWFDKYVNRPQQEGHLKGITPIEVLEAGRGPGVDREQLNDMMLAFDVKSIKRSVIKFNGRNYYHPDFHGRNHKVEIRYDFQDTSYIRVHELTGELICVAHEYGKLHPAAGHLGTDADRLRLSEHCAEHRRQERAASSFASLFLKEEFLPLHRKQMERIGIEPLPIADAKRIGMTKPDSVGAIHESPLHELPQQPMSEDEWLQVQSEAHQIEVVVQEDTPVIDMEATLRAARENVMEEDAVEMRARLEALAEPERYLAVMEMEVRGILIPDRWRDFVRYFRNTLEYLNNTDRYEEKVGMLAVQWQVNDEQKAGCPGN